MREGLIVPSALHPCLWPSLERARLHLADAHGHSPGESAAHIWKKVKNCEDLLPSLKPSSHHQVVVSGLTLKHDAAACCLPPSRRKCRNWGMSPVPCREHLWQLGPDQRHQCNYVPSRRQEGGFCRAQHYGSAAVPRAEMAASAVGCCQRRRDDAQALGHELHRGQWQRHAEGPSYVVLQVLMGQSQWQRRPGLACSWQDRQESSSCSA